MVAEIVSGVRPEDLPLCPAYATEPTGPEHSLVVRMLAAFDAAAAKDDDGEFVSPDVAKAYQAAVERLTPRMDLYAVAVVAPEYGITRLVGGHYFRCRVCGFTLSVDQKALP